MGACNIMTRDNRKALAAGLSFALIVAVSYGFQNAQPAPGTGAGGAADGAPMTASELHALLAPIALYPDALVAQILAAATFPTRSRLRTTGSSKTETYRGDRSSRLSTNNPGMRA